METYDFIEIEEEETESTFHHIHGVVRPGDLWLDLNDERNMDFRKIAEDVKTQTKCIWTYFDETWEDVKGFFVSLGFKKISTQVFKDAIYGTYFYQQPNDSELRHFFPLPEIEKQTIRPVIFPPDDISPVERLLELGTLVDSKVIEVAPGIKIKKRIEDSDRYGTTDGKLMRFHLVYKTNDAVKLNVCNLDGGVDFTTMEPLGIYYVDVRKPHTLANKGKTSYHALNMDMVANEALRNLVMNNHWIEQGTHHAGTTVDSNDDVVIDWNEDVGYAR